MGVAGAFTPRQPNLGRYAPQASPTSRYPDCTPTPLPGTSTPITTPEVRLAPNEYTIGFHGTAGDPAVFQTVDSMAQRYGLQVMEVFEWGPSFYAVVPPGSLASLEADPRVRSVTQATIAPPITGWPPCVLPLSTPTAMPTPEPAANPAPPCAPTAAPVQPGQYIVVLRPDTGDPHQLAAQIAEEYDISVSAVLPSLRMFVADITLDRLAAVRTDPRMRGRREPRCTGAECRTMPH
jgi:hypothetical protein